MSRNSVKWPPAVPIRPREPTVSTLPYAPSEKAYWPIGVFDSGLGGLTVLRAIRRVLPHEDVVYLGDTARVPYGPRSAAVVTRYAKECAQFLMTHQVKMIVVACNTASAHALTQLRAQIDVPVIGVIDSGAQAAASGLTLGKIGVIATRGTIQSGAYERALGRLAPLVKVISASCPLFVPLIEEDWITHSATRLIVETYLAPLKQAGITRLILGCTHYPLLRETIQAAIGEDVDIIDSADAVAQAVAATVSAQQLVRPSGIDSAPGRPPHGVRLFATDVTESMTQVATRFVGHDLGAFTRVDLEELT